MKFIKDIEIENLNGEDDLLQTKKYAQTLKETIVSAETPFTIGLFGEWGSGKSSIVNTVQDELQNNKDQKIKFIKYDAWKYANDSFRRMFIREVQSTLNFDGTEEFNSFYSNRSVDTNVNAKFNGGYFLLIILIFILVLIIVPLINVDQNLQLTLQSIITFFAVAVAFFKNSFTEYKVTTQKPMIFAPEQFESLFDEMMSKSLKKYNIFSLTKEYFKGNHFEKSIDKLIIVIDNIDRCDKETAYELLTNIKNFLERKDIIFVVPIDDSALRRHLKEKNNEDTKEADEFLRKFFNVTLKIKHFQSRDLFMLTDDLNKKYDLNFKPDTIDIIAKEYATNPRRIIQLLNNLISEINVIEHKYDKDVVVEYESLITLLLILREEWSCIYKQIASKPHLLKKTEEIVYDTNSNIQEEVNSFLGRTKAVYENIDEQVIEKLVSNMDNDEKIPSEIIEYIKNSEYDSLQEYIGEIEHYRQLLYYLSKELDTEISRKTFKVGALNRFKNIIKLNELKEIPKQINKQFYGFLHSQEDELIQVIENLDKGHFDNFYNFVDINQKQNIDYLDTIIASKYKEVWNDEIEDEKYLKGKANIWVDGLEYYINNSTNTKQIKGLSTVFHNYYMHYHLNSPLHESEWINEDKLQYVIDKNLIKFLVDNVQLPIENDGLKDLLYLSRKKLVNVKDIEDFFEQSVVISEAVYETTDEEEAKKLFLDNSLRTLTNLLELSKNIPKENEFNSDKITAYLESLNETHTIKYQHPSYPGHRQHDRNMNVNILESMQKKDQEKLLELYIEIYRITANHTSINEYLQILVEKHPSLMENLFKFLIDLRDKHGYSLKPLFSYLIEFTNNDSDLFNLYEKLFIQDEYKESDEVKEKLNTLIQEYLSEENKNIENFLILMLQNTLIKTLIAGIVTELSTKDIVLLPNEIQQLTYDDLCENDKLFEIEDKIDFIIKVLEFDKKYKDCIVKIIVSKLQNKTKVKGALDILENLKYPSDGNKVDIYTALKKQENHTNYSDDVHKYMEKYSTKESD